MMGYGSCLGWDGALGGGWMGSGWPGLFLVVALVAIVAGGTVWAMRSRSRSSDEPLEILKRRFARG